MSFTVSIQTGSMREGIPEVACGQPATIVITPSGTTSDIVFIDAEPGGIFGPNTGNVQAGNPFNPLVPNSPQQPAAGSSPGLGGNGVIFGGTSSPIEIGFTPVFGRQALLRFGTQSGQQVSPTKLLLAVRGSLEPGQIPVTGVGQ